MIVEDVIAGKSGIVLKNPGRVPARREDLREQSSRTDGSLILLIDLEPPGG